MTAEGPSRSRRVAGGRAAVGFRLMIAVLCGAVAAIGGCRPRAAPDAFLARAEVDVTYADSLRAALARTASPPGVSGEGLVRVDLDAAAGPAPVLDLRFEINGDGDCRVMLRPGVLTPVLTFWTDEEGWSIWLPRQRLAFESDAEPEGRTGEEERVGLPVGLPSRVAWLVFAPHELLGLLEAPRAVPHDGDLILRGRAPAMAPWVGGAEIWIAAESGRIARWALIGPIGETLLRVVYDRPWEGPRRGAGMVVLAPGLGGAIRLELTQAREEPVEPRPRPSVPAGWERQAAQALPAYLEDLAGGAN